MQTETYERVRRFWSTLLSGGGTNTGHGKKRLLFAGKQIIIEQYFSNFVCVQITWRCCENTDSISRSLERGQDLSLQTRSKVRFYCWSMDHTLKNRLVMAKVPVVSRGTPFPQHCDGFGHRPRNQTWPVRVSPGLIHECWGWKVLFPSGPFSGK